MDEYRKFGHCFGPCCLLPPANFSGHLSQSTVLSGLVEPNLSYRRLVD